MAALCDCKLPLPVMKDNVVMTNTGEILCLILAYLRFSYWWCFLVICVGQMYYASCPWLIAVLQSPWACSRE